MIWKKILKEMLIFLTMIGIVAQLYPLDKNTDGPLPLHNTSTSNQFSRPYEDGAADTSSYDEVQIVLAGAANRLGIPADEMDQAYDEALSSIIPYPTQQDLSHDREALAPEALTDDMYGNLASLFEIMAINLGISSEDIWEAWQETLEELEDDIDGENAADYTNVQPL
ncbi:MAG: hypothetical protein JXA01_04940 [Dehalococcoidia bacterium]|nr:hypothetical protein [Dehalococcoidia bacterium]